MKLKKRYAIAAVLCSTLFATCQMEFMKFRKGEDKQRAYLLERGQRQFAFGKYEAAGRGMHYTSAGSDSSGLPLVLLVHGSPGSSADMLDYLADSALTCRALLVAVDRPGLGHSGFGRTERSLRRQADALLPLLLKHRAASGGKALLLGHSYGGPLIARIAMDHPELVDGLVIVAGSIDPALEPEYWWARPIDWWGLRWMVPKAFRVSNQEIIPLKKELEDMLPLWEHITCPVTVLQGTDDGLVPAGNAAFAQRMLTRCRRLQVEMLQGEGHFILWTKQPLIASKLLEMLDADLPKAQ